VESFGGRVRDELLAIEMFSCPEEARVLIEVWRGFCPIFCVRSGSY
jgi:hypothetical protein